MITFVDTDSFMNILFSRLPVITADCCFTKECSVFSTVFTFPAFEGDHIYLEDSKIDDT